MAPTCHASLVAYRPVTSLSAPVNMFDKLITSGNDTSNLSKRWYEFRGKLPSEIANRKWSYNHMQNTINTLCNLARSLRNEQIPKCCLVQKWFIHKSVYMGPIHLVILTTLAKKCRLRNTPITNHYYTTVIDKFSEFVKKASIGPNNYEMILFRQITYISQLFLPVGSIHHIRLWIASYYEVCS